MKHIVVIVFILSLFFACKVDPNNFTLRGETSGLEDGTKAYLLHLKANMVLDSTTIRNNRLVISGSLDSFPLKTLLMTDRGDVSGYVWLAPGEITFDASSGSFVNARISGSAAQIVHKHFVAQIDSLSSPDSILTAVANTITSFPDSKVSVELLAEYHRDFPYSTVDKLFQILSTNNQSSYEGQRIAHYLELNQNIAVGDSFVDFEIENINGRVTALSSHLGELTLLHFWASWCDSCRVDNKTLVSLYSTYQQEGLNLFSVSMDHNKNDWEGAVHQDGLTWPQASDLKGRDNKASMIYGVNGTPGYYVIDSSGIVVAHNENIDSIQVVISNRLSR